METIINFVHKFNTEKKCLHYLKEHKGAACPHCKCKKTYEFKDRKLYKCSACKKQFTLKIGTIFEKSRIPLKKWYLAIYLISNNPKGISSVQLSKQIGVTQKTAWFMYHRIRESFRQLGSIFTGTVEVDETFVGGKEKNKHSVKKQGRLELKAPVMGIIHRDSKQVKAAHVPNTKAITLKGYIYDNVKPGSMILTDDNMAYRKINSCYEHEAVSHSLHEYKRGSVSTNSIESFWATFKRGYVGIYHYMSKKHLQRFVNEFAFRHNVRGNRFDYMIQNIDRRLTYKELISN